VARKERVAKPTQFGVALCLMDEDTVRIRANRSRSGEDVLTADAACELRALYDELPDASAAAAEALGSTGALPTGMAMQRFRELDRRVSEIVARIQDILA
jgi:hypothetical protein